MSIVTYFRSSSLKAVDFCEHKYFGEYVLGLNKHDFFETSESVKTTIGTIVHKTLECLAQVSVARAKGLNFIDDEHLGKITFNPKTVMQKTTLTDDEVDKINKTRKNKSKYLNQNSCKLKYGHVRHGVKLVDSLIKKSYEYYSTRIEQDWKPIHLKDIHNYVYMVIDYQVGKSGPIYDPRARNVVAVEPFFDYEIQEDWAKYRYDYKGETLEGYLSIKGTIDLVTELDKNTVEIIDYKTGERKEWSEPDTPVKTPERLARDTQLLLYNYAVRRMYPQYTNVICTIIFARDGGPFSFPMNDSDDIELIKERLKTRFNYVQDMDKPQLLDATHQSFKCQYMCDLYKNKFPKAQSMNCCHYLAKYIDQFGTQKAIDVLTPDNHSVDEYKAPGETDD